MASGGQMKHPLFSEIKPYISYGHYAVNVGWDHIETTITSYNEYGLNSELERVRLLLDK